MQALIADNDHNVDHEELRGFSRSLGELEWLLLILVLLYVSAPGVLLTDRPSVIVAMVIFAAFVVLFRYLNFNRTETQWRLALENWAMIAFISWVIWNTGKVDSPLLNLYLLTIIASALTLGKLATLLEVALIGGLYLYMSQAVFAAELFSLHTLSHLMARLMPFVLVAYLTTMLRADTQSAKRNLKLLSETDAMTGLMNMRAFTSALCQEMEQFKRYARPFSIMMIDADNLKGINDRFGHEAGNAFIKTVAGVIKDKIRRADVPARYGGDEFIVLLPETESLECVHVGDRIRSAVQNTSFDVQGHTPLSATVSIGIVSYPDDATDFEEILAKALDSAQ